jgi:hemolysin activation/secretion protein
MRARIPLPVLSLLLICAGLAGVAGADPIQFRVDGFEVIGDNQLSPAETQALLQKYTGEQHDLEGVQAAAEALEKAHIARGDAFYRVSLPPQTLTDGKVRLEVVGIRLDQMQVTGQSRSSEAAILRSLPALVPGKVPNNRRITRSLKLANRNPVRKVLVTLKQGTRPGFVDADVQAQERRPWILFGAVSNIGSTNTGLVRVTAGGQYNDLLGYDDGLTAVYTVSEERPESVKQYGLTYTVPLYPIASSLSLFHSRSDVDTGTIGDFDVSGAGRFYGISLNHLLLRWGNYDQEIGVDVQDRLFKNDAVFNNAVNLGADVRSRPLTLSYLGRYQTQSLRFNIYCSYVVNTGGGRLNNQTAYTLARPGSVSDWDAFRFGSEASLDLPHKWQLRGLVDAQLASHALIPGEQFGLGGMYSVRGFEERALSADSGARLTAEVWCPPITFLPGLRLLAFVDAGYKDLEVTTPGEAATDVIASIGLGARWQWRDNISLSIDYGNVIDRAQQIASTADRGNVKWHFNLLLKY